MAKNEWDIKYLSNMDIIAMLKRAEYLSDIMATSPHVRTLQSKYCLEISAICKRITHIFFKEDIHYGRRTKQERDEKKGKGDGKKT